MQVIGKVDKSNGDSNGSGDEHKMELVFLADAQLKDGQRFITDLNEFKTSSFIYPPAKTFD